MDISAALALFFLLSTVADGAHAAKFRYLAADPPQNNQVSGKNKQDPNLDAAAKKSENVQASINSPPLDNKPLNKKDLGSPQPEKQTSDHNKNLDFLNSGRFPVENRTENYEKTQKGVENLDNGKKLSRPDKGKLPEHVNGTDLLRSRDNGMSLEHVNGTELLSPSPVQKSVNATDLSSPSPVKKSVNATDLLTPPVNETDNGSDGRVKEKTADDKINAMADGKVAGAKEKTVDDKSKEMDNGKSEEKTIDNKSNEMENGRNGGAKEKTIGDKSIEKDNEKNGGVKDITDKGNDNGESEEVKDKTIDDKRDNGKKDDGQDDSVHGKSSSELGVNEKCEGLPTCKDLDTLIACIQSFDTGSRELTVLVKNGGENNLMVNLTLPTDGENPLKPLKISKHQTQKITILLSASTKLILNAGNGECVLHTDRSEPKENIFIYLPSYDKLLTPINGAYFLILSVLIFGGTWACCKYRKRRWNDGVPYQELEMGLPESVPAADLESAEGWDQGWDDDWDENTAVKSPTASRIGSISANGLTSRSPNRDGWEQDWDE